MSEFNISAGSKINPTEKVFHSLKEAEKTPDLVFKLDLHYKNYSTLPGIIFHFSNLQELILINNKIESIPDEIANLQNLQKLELSGNRVKVIPDALDRKSVV